MKHEKANKENGKRKDKGNERKEEVRKNEEEKTADKNGNEKPYRKGGHAKAKGADGSDSLFLYITDP